MVKQLPIPAGEDRTRFDRGSLAVVLYHDTSRFWEFPTSQLCLNSDGCRRRRTINARASCKLGLGDILDCYTMLAYVYAVAVGACPDTRSLHAPR